MRHIHGAFYFLFGRLTNLRALGCFSAQLHRDLEICKWCLVVSPATLQSKTDLGIEDYSQKSCISMAPGYMKKEKRSGTGFLSAHSKGETRRGSFFVRVPPCNWYREEQEVLQICSQRLLLNLGPTCQSSVTYRQAGVAGNTFRLVWTLPAAPQVGEIRLADKGSGH